MSLRFLFSQNSFGRICLVPVRKYLEKNGKCKKYTIKIERCFLRTKKEGGWAKQPRRRYGNIQKQFKDEKIR